MQECRANTMFRITKKKKSKPRKTYGKADEAEYKESMLFKYLLNLDCNLVESMKSKTQAKIPEFCFTGKEIGGIGVLARTKNGEHNIIQPIRISSNLSQKGKHY